MIGTSLLFSGSIGGLLTPFDSDAPTAGYSLRNLGLSYSGAVVRVRKDITGNPEQDFTAGQITNGTLSDFLETLGTDAHSQSISAQFEDVSDVSLICACNSGGVDELDAFDALYENGFVSKWYDQFGSNNAEQTSASAQPKIWDASTGLVTENGKPAVEFDGTDDHLINTVLKINPVPFSLFVLSQTNDTNSAKHIIDQSESSSAGFLFRVVSSQYEYFYYPDATNEFFGSVTTEQALTSLFVANGAQSGFVDGSGLYSNTLSITNNPVPTYDFWIGGDVDNAGRYFNGNIQEIIIYDTDQSANRTKIEDNINDYYDIY